MKKFIKNYKITDISVLILGVFLFVSLVRRLHYTLSYYDEVFNIYVSYLTVVMGKRHLVENTFPFSMGNLINLPFVYIYYKLTGGMDGIVLFIRYAQLAVNIVLSLIFVSVFRKCLGIRNCILFGLILIAYVPCSIYSLSYNTAPLFFMFAGELFLIGSEFKNNEMGGALRYFAGISHACMVYSWPTMIIIILVLFIGNSAFYKKRDRMKIKGMLHYWLPYILGGITVFTLFGVYVLSIGWENIYFFQEHNVEKILSGRTLGQLMIVTDGKSSLVKNILIKVYSILHHVWQQQRATIWPTLVMLIQWAIGMVRKSKIMRLLLIVEIIFVAVFPHNGIVDWALTSMFAYYFFWAPFLYFYMDDEDKKVGKFLMLELWITSIAAFLAVGFLALGDEKASMGLYSGAICTFIFMIFILSKSFLLNENMIYPSLIILFIAAGNIFMLYNNVYEGAEVSECDYLMEKGIYKGLITKKEDVIYEKMSEIFEKLQLKEGSMLCLSDAHYTAAYIEGNFLYGTTSFLLEQEKRFREGDRIEGIYDKETWPDIVLIREKNFDTYTMFQDSLMVQVYDLTYIEKGQYYLYTKNEGN